MDNSNAKYLIYALHHDSSEHVYVGKSSSGLSRPKDHGRPAKMRENTRAPVTKWVEKRRASGQDYEIVVLEVCEKQEDLNDAEKFHIAYLRSIGASLLNVTDGGDGASGTKHKPETIEKLRAINSTPERKALQREIMLGRKHSPETIEHLRVAHTTPEAIERSRRTHLGVKRSDQTKARLSAALTGKTRSQEVREKMSAVGKELAATPEGKARLGAMAAKSQTEEVRARAVAAHRAAMTPEYCQKMSEQKIAEAATPEGYARLVAASASRTEETFAKTAASHKERATTEEGKKHLLKAAHSRTPDTFAKIAETQSVKTSLFEGVDWSLSNSVIGKQVGVTNHTVTKVRKRLGIAPSTHVSGNGRKPFSADRFIGVNWSLTDFAIGKLIGMSNKAVKRARDRLRRGVL